MGLEDFNLYICDRNIFNSSKKTGGGVLLAIRKSIISSELCLKTQSFEQVSVKIKIGEKKHLYLTHLFSPNTINIFMKFKILF